MKTITQKPKTRIESLSDTLYSVLQDLDKAQDLVTEIYPKNVLNYKWQKLHTAICSIRDCVGAP